VPRFPDLVVAGAGMGGLVAAVRATELRASVVVHERAPEPGGSMLLSSGVIWRYREWDRFREECPGGDPALQRLVWERLDESLAWLETLGAPVVARETGNPATEGVRFDPPGLTETLARRAGDIRLREQLWELPAAVPVVLATGGFQGDRTLVRQFITPEADSLVLRANPQSTGDGLRLALERGAELSDGLDEFYGRAMPAPPARVTPATFASLAQVYARHAMVRNGRGEVYEARTWSEVDVVQWIARQPGARAWYLVRDEALGERVRDRTVGEMIEAARSAGARVSERDGGVELEVVAGITQTLGGIRVDERAWAAEGVLACGADVGGISTGGWSSGLAAALVLGLTAAEEALR